MIHIDDFKIQFDTLKKVKIFFVKFLGSFSKWTTSLLKRLVTLIMIHIHDLKYNFTHSKRSKSSSLGSSDLLELPPLHPSVQSLSPQSLSSPLSSLYSLLKTSLAGFFCFWNWFFQFSSRLMMLISQAGVTTCLFVISGYFLAERSFSVIEAENN